MDLAHRVRTDVGPAHRLYMADNVASQFIAPFPGSHALWRGESLRSKTKRTVPRPDEGITVRDYFAPPGHALLEVPAAMIFPLFCAREGKALVAVLQLRLLAPKHLAAFLALAVLNMIRSLRASPTEEY